MAQDNVREWLRQASNEPLGPDDRRNLDLMKDLWTEAVGLGEKRIEAFERARSASYAAWTAEKRKAEAGHPEQADFNAILPSFKTMLGELRTKGEKLGEAFGVSPYQALMYVSNPGLSKEVVDKVLGELGAELPGLARTIIDKQKSEPPPIPLPVIAEEDQIRVVRRLMHALGLDENHARADQCAHPGSYMQWSEQRVTVRRGEQELLSELNLTPRNTLLSRLIGLIHESGHEIYAKKLPREWKDQPIGNPQSMWVHESQSLFWEREVAFTMPFMRFLSKLIREELGGKYDMSSPAWDAENLFRHVMHVLPENRIRTEADDVTYPIHIIIRNELGPKLFDGTIPPEEWPTHWNKAYREKLGVEVKNIMEGCMQDMQMPFGNFPGFPGYTFGRGGAAMLGSAIRCDMDGQNGRADFNTLIENGNFAPIADWLGNKIHRHGSRYEGVELIERAVDEDRKIKFSMQPFLNELRERYGIPAIPASHAAERNATLSSTATNLDI